MAGSYRCEPACRERRRRSSEEGAAARGGQGRSDAAVGCPAWVLRSGLARHRRRDHAADLRNLRHPMPLEGTLCRKLAAGPPRNPAWWRRAASNERRTTALSRLANGWPPVPCESVPEVGRRVIWDVRCRKLERRGWPAPRGPVRGHQGAQRTLMPPTVGPAWVGGARAHPARADAPNVPGGRQQPGVAAPTTLLRRRALALRSHATLAGRHRAVEVRSWDAVEAALRSCISPSSSDGDEEA